MEKFILDFGNMSFDTTLKLSDYSFASSTDNHSTNSSNNSKDPNIESASRNHQCLPSEDEDDGPVLGKYMNSKSHRLKIMEKPTRDHYSHFDDDDNQVLGLRLSRMKQQKKNERRGHMKRNSMYAAPLVSLTDKTEPKRMSISGMDLLKQLEQRKADAKRQKPKIDPSQAKIQGLLSRLPEPGLHTISFQQKHFQNKTQRKYRA